MDELRVPTLADFVRARRLRPTEAHPSSSSRQQLGTQPDFHRLWNTGRVYIGRRDPTIRLQNRKTGKLFEIRVQRFRTTVPESTRQLFVGLIEDTAAASWFRVLDRDVDVGRTLLSVATFVGHCEPGWFTPLLGWVVSCG